MRLSCINLLLFSSLLSVAPFSSHGSELQRTDTEVTTTEPAAHLVPAEDSVTDSGMNTSANLLAEPLPEPQYDLMLIGGGLNTCSSMTPSACTEGATFNELAKTSSLYLLQASQLQNFATAELFTPERQTLQQQLLALFSDLAVAHTSALKESELFQLWRAAAPSEHHPGGEALWQELSARELNVLLDYLEVTAVNTEGKYRLTEQVDLALTEDQVSAELYREFVKLANVKAQTKGRSKPTILVVTASSRDPFAAVNFYLDAFRQAGANANWLPLTAAIQAAIQAKNCQALPQYLAELHGSYRREQIYPELYASKIKACQAGSSALVKAISEADGIFFNGGDQSLTYQALRNHDGSATIELEAIFKAVASKQLLVGGTSAGTAVMSGSQWLTPERVPVPMITNGDGYHALQYGAVAAAAPWLGCRKENRCPDNLSERQLTYTAAGGLGLFPLGILDTHFAERGRQARLVVLQQATNTQLAFGIDEATALLVDLGGYANDTVQMAARGAAEVYVSKLAPESTTTELLAHTYTLTAGDTLIWHAGELSLKPAADKVALAAEAEPLHSKSPLFSRDHYRSLSRSLCRSNFHSATVSEPPYLIRLSKEGVCHVDPSGNLSYQQQLRIISPTE